MRRLAALLGLLACACAAPRQARMPVRTVQSPAMGRPMQYALYTPPGWARGEPLPLFLFLHGGGGDAVDCLETSGVAAWLDREMAQGRLPRATFVVPQGDRGFWANWADGTRRYQDWALDEALPRAMEELGTPGCPAGCHLVGISMGGNGALRAALARPGRFATVAVLSGPTLDSKGMDAMLDDWFFRTFARLDRVFGSKDDVARKRAADPFLAWRRPEDLRGARLLLAHGSADRPGLGETNRALHAHLLQAGVPHRYLVFLGGHRWEDWTPVFGEVLRWALGPGEGRGCQSGYAQGFAAMSALRPATQVLCSSP